MIYKARSENKHILIVEDEESLCEILKDELDNLGYKVTIARNGVEGLSRLQEIEPDLIICDRAMPAMTGSELLERIRGVHPQYRDTPFIFLTALSGAAEREAVKPLAPTAYLEKPLDFDVLKETIEQALGPRSE